MKAPILVPLFVALAGSIASAAELSVFRVCQDQRVIHTSDGAEAGRVEYIVVDPADQHVVSTVISGGVVGERLIAVPYNSLRFTSNNEITLTEITRERLVSAPVIERTQISASVIEPSIIQRTTTHFSARGDMRGDRTTVEGRTEVEGSASVTGRSNDRRSNGEAARTGEAPSNAEAAGNRDPKAHSAAASRRDAEARTQAEAERTRADKNGNRPPGAKANETDAAAAAKEQGAANQDPNSVTKSEALRKHNAKGESEAAKNKADAARPENAEENRSGTKPNRDTNNNSPKADANREHNENARPQGEAQPGRERKGAADRNASAETPKGRKAVEENATDSKRPPKKAQEPAGEEKARNEQRSPQL